MIIHLKTTLVIFVLCVVGSAHSAEVNIPLTMVDVTATQNAYTGDKERERNAFNQFVKENHITVTPEEQLALRLYKEPSKAFPKSAKCEKWDGRLRHGCVEFRVFDPSARVYIDTGDDDPDELDIFDNGELSVAVDVLSAYWPWRFSTNPKFDKYRYGPLVGIGLASPADNSQDGSKESSGAPVIYASVGGLFEYKVSGKNSVGFELGYALGYSADEGFKDSDDGAVYVGFKVRFEPFTFGKE